MLVSGYGEKALHMELIVQKEKEGKGKSATGRRSKEWVKPQNET